MKPSSIISGEYFFISYCKSIPRLKASIKLYRIIFPPHRNKGIRYAIGK